jgi:hypothetical protein
MTLKRKLEDSYGILPSNPIRANEIIDLFFVQEELKNAYLVTPTFTHQLFNNERINDLCNPTDARIKIYIMCSDLTQFLQFNSFIFPEEQTRLQRHLSFALPDDCILLPPDRPPSAVFRPNCYSSPPGKCIRRFSATEDDYEIWLANSGDAKASTLLKSAERIAVWFIETADPIDFSGTFSVMYSVRVYVSSVG